MCRIAIPQSMREYARRNRLVRAVLRKRLRQVHKRCPDLLAAWPVRPCGAGVAQDAREEGLAVCQRDDRHPHGCHHLLLENGGVGEELLAKGLWQAARRWVNTSDGRADCVRFAARTRGPMGRTCGESNQIKRKAHSPIRPTPYVLAAAGWRGCSAAARCRASLGPARPRPARDWGALVGVGCFVGLCTA